MDPDAVLVNDNLDIDFNGDGIVDFTLEQYNFGYGTFESNFAALDGNPAFSYGIVAVPGVYYPASAMTAGSIIGPSASFNTSGYDILGSFFAFGSSVFGVGEWSAVTDRYLGVKFQIGPNTHYGWIRLDAEINCSALRVKDFAYEDSPGVPIAAGDASSAVAAGAASLLVAADVADNGNGTDPVLTFGAATRDASGALIAPGTPYRCFVLSVADGTVATVNALAGPSNPVSLLASADVARNIEAFDVANNGNGSDMRVVFANALNEATVSEYRLMVVDSADAAGFDLVAANAVVIPNYTERIPVGGIQNFLLTATAQTVSGEPIANDKPYQLFILSVADGTLAQNNQLSEPSEPITLRVLSGLAGQTPDLSQFQATLQGHNLMIQAETVFSPGELRLYSSDGRALGQWPYSGGSMRLELSDLAEQDGLFLLQWQVENQQVSRKLISAH